MNDYGMARFVKIADALSVANACAGFTSILFAIDGEIFIAFALLVVAAIFDSLDGRVARHTTGASDFGVDLDSLSDTVSFAVAPAVILYYSVPYHDFLATCAALVFMASTLLRLARYDVMHLLPKQYPQEAHVYAGLPVPVAALIAAASVCVSSLYPECWPVGNYAVIALYVGLSLLMLSALEFRKPRWMW